MDSHPCHAMFSCTCNAIMPMHFFLHVTCIYMSATCNINTPWIIIINTYNSPPCTTHVNTSYNIHKHVTFILHVIHISNNTQQGLNLGPIQQGTSRPLHNHEPVWFQSSIQHQTTINLETLRFQFKPQPTTVLDSMKPVIEILYP